MHSKHVCYVIPFFFFHFLKMNQDVLEEEGGKKTL